MKKQNNIKCLINRKIDITKAYSFCTQCMDMPVIDEDGYCEICNDLVDDEKIDKVIQDQLKASA